MYQHRDKRGSVTLTREELDVTDLFLLCVIEGYSIIEAACYALSVMPEPDPQFITWLSQGMLGHELH